MAYLGKQLIRQLGGRAPLTVANDLFKLAVAEGIAMGILGRSVYAVCVEQESVTWGERHCTNRVVIAVLSHPEK